MELHDAINETTKGQTHKQVYIDMLLVSAIKDVQKELQKRASYNGKLVTKISFIDASRALGMSYMGLDNINIVEKKGKKSRRIIVM